MPVGNNLEEVIYQRELHSRSRISRGFRNFLCRLALEALDGAKKILDAGCGEGLLLEKIAAEKKGGLACGVDLNAENVKICLLHNLTAVLADAGRLPFADGVFDGCVMTEVIEHLEEGRPRAVVGEIARVLRPGGRLFLMFPNDRNYKIARILALKFKEAFYDAGHIRQWAPKEALALLRESSFVPDKSFSVPVDIWPFSLHHIVIATKGAAPG